MNRGRRHEKIFFAERDYHLFLNILKQAIALYAIEVHAYSLMPNHYHLLIRTQRANLSAAMHYLGFLFAQTMNIRYRFDGALFRGRYKSPLIEADRYLLDVARYIHLNPVKAGLAKTPAEHPWTSHGAYLDPRQRPEWLKTDTLLSWFSPASDPPKAIASFHRFVTGTISENTAQLYEALDSERWPAVIGDDGFKEQLKETTLDNARGPEDYGLKHEWMSRVSISDAINAICAVLKCPENVITRKSRGIGGLARRLLVYVCRQNLKKDYKELANALAPISTTALSKLYHRASQEIEQTVAIQRRYHQIQKRILKPGRVECSYGSDEVRHLAT